MFQGSRGRKVATKDADRELVKVYRVEEGVTTDVLRKRLRGGPI